MNPDQCYLNMKVIIKVIIKVIMKVR